MILTVTLSPAFDRQYTVSELLPGKTNRVRSCARSVGGKGINVARAAVLLECRTAATGFLGGASGNDILKDLQDFGISCAFIPIEKETRSCVSVFDLLKQSQTEFLEPGTPVSEKELHAFLKQYRALLKEADLVVLSGSVPEGCGADIYQKLIECAKEAGIHAVLDTSGEPFRYGVAGKPFMVKPNRHELETYMGQTLCATEELLDAAQELHKKGIPVVLVSLGSEGALLSCPEGVYESKALEIPVVNTVGCGDSMVAGFCAGMENGLSMKEAFRCSMAASMANALTDRSGYFTTQDYFSLFEKVSVKKVK